MTEKLKDGGTSTLSLRQLKALPFLVTCPTNEEARRKVKVSRETLNRWLHEPAFQDELKRQREAVATEAYSRLKAAMLEATDALLGLLKTDNERLRRDVANDIVRINLQVREMEDFADRLSRLEDAVNQNEGAW